MTLKDLAKDDNSFEILSGLTTVSGPPQTRVARHPAVEMRNETDA